MESFMRIISLLVLCAFTCTLAHEGHDHLHHKTQNLSSELQLPITIYYESLCPDSIAFFKNQLEPTYKDLGKYMDINFVPYGRTTQWYSNNSYHFNCPHGTIECYGNIVQACAIEVYHDQHNLYKYITCLMTTVNPQNISNATYPVKDCANNLDLDNLDKCVNGSDGLKFLSAMGNNTSALKPQLKSVPAIAVNMTYSYEEQPKATSDFRSLVCSHLKAVDKNLAECSSSSLTAASSILLVVTLASHFLASITS